VRYASIPLGTRRIHKVHNKEYWVIKVAGGGRWPLEHRHIMATRLGRRLRTNEHVHHRDNNGLNNGLHADGKDNLMLMSASKHIKLTHQETPPNTPYCTCPCCGQTHFKKNKPTD
jgi:hypothetical protein